MSSYIRNTKNPKTGRFEPAYWLDDYFSHHHYGVKFPDGLVVDPKKVKLETNDLPVDKTWDDYPERPGIAV